MTQLLYAEIKLNKGSEEEFLDLIRSPLGLPLTKSMTGFISAETAMSTDEAGQSTFHLWEKWKNMTDFENYMASPNRDPKCDFMQKWTGMMSDAPRMVFPELLLV